MGYADVYTHTDTSGQTLRVETAESEDLVGHYYWVCMEQTQTEHRAYHFQAMFVSRQELERLVFALTTEMESMDHG